MRKKFTLIELIIVIVVIGLLAAMVLAKVTGVVKSARISAMINDKEVLEKTILLYYQKHDNFPLLNEESKDLLTKIRSSDMSTIYESLQKTLKYYEDNEENLYKIDISKINDSLSKKLKYGYEKTDKDFYVYSTKTNNVYYYAYLQGDKEEYYHSGYPIEIKDNKLIERLNDIEVDKDTDIEEDIGIDLNIEPSTDQEGVTFNENWAKPLFDSNLSTGVTINAASPRYLTWEGDLSNNILEMYATSVYSNINVTFYDKNDKVLPTYNLTSKTYDKDYKLPRDNTGHKILVPSGAKKIQFSRENNGDGEINEIKLFKGPKSTIKNIKTTFGQYNTILDFKADENFKSLIVFSDGYYVGETTTANSINLKKLCSNTTYNLQIMVLSKDSTCSGIYQHTIKTEDDELGLYIPLSNSKCYSFIDGDTKKYISFDKYSLKPEIEFRKELGGKKLVLYLKNHYEKLNVIFYDKNNKVLSTTRLTRTEGLTVAVIKEITIPNGSKKVELSQSTAYDSVQLSEVVIK